jgi:hypothetical protein
MKLSRRNLLRGAGGLAVSLPFLESLAPRAAHAAGVTPPKRLAIVVTCNGVNMERWFPATSYGPLTAESFPSTVALHPLKDYAAKLLIPRGMHLVPYGEGHSGGIAHKLTAAPLQDWWERYPKGASLDHVVARSINPEGRGPLNLMVGFRMPNEWGSVSYSAPGVQAVPFQDPWKAFKDWANVGTDTAAQELERAARRRRSVLDVVREDLLSLQGSTRLGRSDRDKLDLHFTSIRSLERGMGDAGLITCALPQARMAELAAVNPYTVALDSEYERIGGMMMDILALALACGQNRVATLQWGSEAVGPVFTWLGKNPEDAAGRYLHHALSHGNTSSISIFPNLPTATWKDALFRIDSWYAAQFKSLLDRLSRYTEPGGSVLDNTAVCLMNNLSEGLTHDTRDLPTLIAGSCGGYFKQGQYVKLTRGADTNNQTDAPSNKLLTTLANAVGARRPDGSPFTDFGSTPAGQPGEFTELRA